MRALIAFLALLLVGLLIYSLPVLSEITLPKGELTQGLVSGLVLLIIQLLATRLIVDRAFEGARAKARQAARAEIHDDAHNIIELYKNIQDEFTGQKDSLIFRTFRSKDALVMGVNPITIHAFHSALRSPSTEAALHLLSRSLDAKDLPHISSYMSGRAGMLNNLELAMAKNASDAFLADLFSTDNNAGITNSATLEMTRLEAFWFLDNFLRVFKAVKDLNVPVQGYAAAFERATVAYKRLETYFDRGPA